MARIGFSLLFSIAAGDDRASMCAKATPRRCVIVTQRRSGSGMVISMLASHPRAETGGELLLSVNGEERRTEVLDAWFNRWGHTPLDHAASEHLWNLPGMGGAGLDPPLSNATEPSATVFKYIMTSETAEDASVLAVLRDRCVGVVFLWRWNALRQMVSQYANKADKKFGGILNYTHEAHPTDAHALAQHQAHTVTLLSGPALVKHLGSMLRHRRTIADSWRSLSSDVHTVFYEDLVAGAEHADTTRVAIQRFLGVEPHELTTTLLQIHGDGDGDLPLSHTIDNWEDVSAALAPTPYAAYLRDYNHDTALSFETLSLGLMGNKIK